MIIKKYKSIGGNDCLRGCLANILEIPARNLPNPIKLWENSDKSEHWMVFANRFYENYGFRIRFTNNKKQLKIGVSENKKQHRAHALICNNGKPIFCPVRGEKFGYKKNHIKYFIEVVKL